MSSNPNKVSQFWQELKHRNVVRVISVYAAAAFVILELTDIVVPSLGLPEWSLNFIIILLCVGFIISVILSWIYDFHPEGGLVETDAGQKDKAEKIPKSSDSWKIASYISFVVIAGLIVLNIIPRINQDAGKEESAEKSIAVIPFTSLSDDLDKQYLADGVMDAILLHLSKIKDLRVMSRTSVEQYRKTEKTTTAICEELDVAYLLEGSFQKYGDQARLIVQLIRSGKEDHVWASQYDRDWKDIFSVQSEVAQTIATELSAVITPEEKALIEKVPTSSMTAYDYCLQGREEYLKSLMTFEYGKTLEKAEFFFHKALECDPEFAIAYSWLAIIRYSKYSILALSGDQYAADYFYSRNLDSMNMLADKAIGLDDQLADAYYVKGTYQQERGKLIKALELMQHALAIDPNHSMAMIGAASVSADLYDFVHALELLHKASRLEHGYTKGLISAALFSTYWEIGFPELIDKYLKEYLSVVGDSITYNVFMCLVEIQKGNQERSIEYAKIAYGIDSTDTNAILYMGSAHLYSKMYDQAYPYYSRYFSGLVSSGDLDVNDMNRMGYLLWMIGEKEQARYYFREMIRHCKRHIGMNSIYGRMAARFDIAGVYAFQGENDSAYHYLEELTRTNWQTSYSLAMLNGLDPLFEPIRQEERFRQLVRKMETKYQTEHERVRQWLEENDML